LKLFAFEVSDDTSVFAMTEREAAVLTAVQATDSKGYFREATRLAGQTTLLPCSADGTEATAADFCPSDFGVWGVCATFSERAKTVLCHLGAEAADFHRVSLKTNPSEYSFIFLPEQIHDIVDPKSILSKHKIPTTPALPFWITRAHPRHGIDSVPPVFMNVFEGGQAWLTEHFASEVLVSSWNNLGLKGARFRAL
jgi:hypothetical protein